MRAVDTRTQFAGLLPIRFVRLETGSLHASSAEAFEEGLFFMGCERTLMEIPFSISYALYLCQMKRTE